MIQFQLSTLENTRQKERRIILYMSIIFNPAGDELIYSDFQSQFFCLFFFSKRRITAIFFTVFIAPCHIISGTNYVRFCFFYQSCSLLTKVFFLSYRCGDAFMKQCRELNTSLSLFFLFFLPACPEGRPVHLRY